MHATLEADFSLENGYGHRQSRVEGYDAGGKYPEDALHIRGARADRETRIDSCCSTLVVEILNTSDLQITSYHMLNQGNSSFLSLK